MPPAGSVSPSGLEAAESQTIMEPQSLRPLLQLQKQLPHIGTTTSQAGGRHNLLPHESSWVQPLENIKHLDRLGLAGGITGVSGWSEL